MEPDDRINFTNAFSDLCFKLLIFRAVLKTLFNIEINKDAS